jgi:hypothetical protein
MTTRKTRGVPAGTKIYTQGVDPFVVQLRTEQVRQGLSDYALGLATGITPARLGKMWKGTKPTLEALRKIQEHLVQGNPKFKLRDQ